MRLIKVRATDINPYTRQGRRWEVFHVLSLDTATAIRKIKQIRPEETWIFRAELVEEEVTLIDGWEE